MTAANVDILRRGWSDALTALAPTVDELPKLLGARLDEAVRSDQLDEHALLRVVDEAADVAVAAMPADAATSLTRRLQRAVYEYLLSLDAMRPEEAAHEPSPDHRNLDPDLIGAEEVAALAGRVTDGPPRLEIVPPPAEAEPDSDESKAEEKSSELAERVPEEAAPPTRRPRFTLFRRTDSATTTEPAEAAVNGTESHEEIAVAEPAPPQTAGKAPAPAPAPIEAPAVADAPEPVAAEAPDPEPAAIPTSPSPQPAATKPAAQFEEISVPSAHPESVLEPAEGGAIPFVAPRDGFHLSDLNDLTRAAAPDTTPLPTPEEEPKTEDDPIYGGKGWRVRGMRGDAEPRKAPRTVLTGPGDAALLEAMEPEQQAQLQNRFETDPDVVEARRQIRDRLRRRRCDEAAALLQGLAQELGGRSVAELALDAGDRCRSLGKTNAALSCYLAASRADPVHELPLMRLADICLDDHDIDLAASYLERVARLHRLRDDDAGALRIYRKLATIAPFREDILSMLVRAQATGRFDD
jgi:hypothetical protein